MAEADEGSRVNHCLSSPPQFSAPFMEVICKSSGKTRRFAAGTNAGFALNLINRKLESGVPPASYIEAVKGGEEPVSFGPNSVLVDYGHDWKLQTVTEAEEGLRERECDWPTTTLKSSVKGLHGSYLMKEVPRPIFSFLYIGKILIAFILMFVIGAIFTFALENLPRLILYINSSL